MNSSQEKIFKVVKTIPKGKVMTYKQVAEKSGIKSPRVVGNLLNKNVDPKNIPCHRVVRSDGKIATGYAFGGKEAQSEILQKEGIVIVNGRIDLEKYAYI